MLRTLILRMNPPPYKMHKNISQFNRRCGSSPKENLLVIVDELALPFGSLRLRAKGSAAGHNGLKNIELLLGGQDYPRLRFGIGDNFSKGQQVDYVLSNFTKKELEELPFAMDKSIEMILSFCTVGIERTMNFYNS